MPQFPFVAAAGFLILGFVLAVFLYPRVIHWARTYTDEFHGGKCFYCDRETYVTPCKRCGKDVAFCHYYSVLGTDVPEGPSLRMRKRRSSEICTECLSVQERNSLESLLKG